MKKFLTLGLLFTLGACANLMGPTASTAPATPVFFQSFSAALDQAALSTIASAAEAAKQQPGARVIVTGAADSVGSTQANKYLSETRAQVVADALAADGVDASRIHVRAVGIVSAPVPVGTPAQSARRVLIQIQG